MREILFRGKRKDNGEWVCGNLFVPDNPDKPTEILIGTNAVRISYEVIPETVGQYTGLTDKNGKKIFEGDILDTPDRLVFVTWFNTNAQFDCGFLRYAHGIEIKNFKGIFPRDFYKYEVIGNIYDNKEILDVK